MVSFTDEALPERDIGAGAATPADRKRASPTTLPLISFGIDLVVVSVSIWLAATLRQGLPFVQGADDVAALVAVLGGPLAVVWLAMLKLFGTYGPHRLSAGLEEYKNVVNASVVAAGLLGIACYLGKIPLSRGFFLLAFLIGIPALLLDRVMLRRVLHRARQRGLFQHRVLIAGDSAHVDEICAVMRRESWLGYDVVGALSPASPTAEAHLDATPRGIPFVGSAAHAEDLAVRLGADALVVAGGAFPGSVELRRAQWALEEHHVQLIVAPSVTDVARERVTVRPVAGLPLVFLEPPASRNAVRWAKRSFDLVGSVVLLLVFSPAMLVAAIAVRRDDGGPVLFRQSRVGRDGEPFAMLKFRSMVVDAEARLAELTETDEGNGVMFKMTADPRITRPGRWMRRTSVDELPQLFNVLRGEMSLVGPRPALPAEVEHYDNDTVRRLRVRPGLTGLWQVSGRSHLPWEETVRLDLYYVDNWSMLADLIILVRTVRAVFRADGAY